MHRSDSMGVSIGPRQELLLPVRTGFLWFTLLVALLGPAAAGPAIVTILVDMVLTTSLCGKGEGTTPAATRPEMCAMSDSRYAPCASATARMRG
jgi:hypothetical protein